MSKKKEKAQGIRRLGTAGRGTMKKVGDVVWSQAYLVLFCTSLFMMFSVWAGAQPHRYGVVFGQQGNEVEMQVVPARSRIASSPMPSPGDTSVTAIVGAPVSRPTGALPPKPVESTVSLKSQSVQDYKEDGFDISIDGIAGEAFTQELDVAGKVSVDILFDFDQATIKAASIPALNAILSMMKGRPEQRIRVEGYTDYRGPVDYNFELSVQRAYSDKRWLVEHGIESTRIDYVGKGQRGDADDTEAQQTLNRRVDIVKL